MHIPAIQEDAHLRVDVLDFAVEVLLHRAVRGGLVLYFPLGEVGHTLVDDKLFFFCHLIDC